MCVTKRIEGYAAYEIDFLGRSENLDAKLGRPPLTLPHSKRVHLSYMEAGGSNKIIVSDALAGG